MARLAPRALAAVRDASVTCYPLDDEHEANTAAPTVGQARGAYSISIEAKTDVYLSAYAKTGNVVRYEVRYRRRLSRAMRSGSWVSDMPFYDRLVAIMADGNRRLVPKVHALHRVVDDPAFEEPEDPASLIAELAEEVRAASAALSEDAYFRQSFELLLLQGGLTASPAISIPSTRLVLALAARGVLEYMPSDLRAEPRTGRKYILAKRFRSLLRDYG
jgi:hypothetical protein